MAAPIGKPRCSAFLALRYGQRTSSIGSMNLLAEQLHQQIQQHGPLPFAEFMQRALYDPVHGYYGRADAQIGRRGDFMTSVSVGSFFGELLAFQFVRWIKTMPRDGEQPAQIVESGAHDGQLAHDILSALSAHGAESKIEYWIIEPSEQRRQTQRRKLQSFANVRWFVGFDEIQARVHGVVFCNELLDAMPVHPFTWNSIQRRWEERGVTISEEQFLWTPLERSTIAPPELPTTLLDVLPDGYILELCPAAVQWWQNAAHALAGGRLLTIDYGGVLEEMLSPGRNTGTLRAYFRHQVSANVLERPGEQDITAHVNFTEVQRGGENAGLRTESFTAQSQFLTAIARELWTSTGSWPQQQVRQFQTLTHPEHLGRSFRVLVQAR